MVECSLSKTWRAGVCALIFTGSLCAAVSAPFQNVSVRDAGQNVPAVGGGDSVLPIIGADGRYVVFGSTAENLVQGAPGASLSPVWPPPFNVFVRDRVNQTTVLASVNLSGVGGGNSNSFAAGISSNGQFVVFESSATNLWVSDNNRAPDIFVRDLLNGSNILVSVSTNSKVGNFGSRSPVMTPDGRYVAFVSEADNLAPGDANYIPDVYWRDLQSQTTMLVSEGAKKTSSGIAQQLQRFQNTGSSEAPQISADGRYVAFYSSATNLIPGLTNFGDIYLRDVVDGTTTWVSSFARTALQGSFGVDNAVSFSHVLSGDGQYVAFAVSASRSSAAGIILRYNRITALTDVIHTNAYVPAAAWETIRNLDMTPDGRFIAFVANTNGNTGATTCVLVWDAQTGTTTLASANTNGLVPANSTCAWPALDASGQHVTFVSTATNLVANPLLGDTHVYVRDLQAGTMTLVDVDTNGVGSLVGAGAVPQISADGAFVAFECDDAALVAEDRNRATDVFVRNLSTAGVELISAADSGLAPAITPNGSSSLAPGCVSTNGRYVVFVSDANNLVPGDTNGFPDVFVRDLWAGTNILVSVGTNSFCGDGPSSEPVISGDGRYVAFASLADNLVPGDTNKLADIFLRDLQLGATYLVSLGTNGVSPGDHASRSPSISDDGRFVFFFSLAWNLGARKAGPATEIAVVRDMAQSTNRIFQSSVSPTSACLSEGGAFVAFNGYAGNFQYGLVWDNYAAALVATNTVNTNCAISADGKRVGYISIPSSSHVCVLDGLNNTNWDTHILSTAAKSQMRFSNNGRYLAYSATLGQNVFDVYVLDCETGQNETITRGYVAGQSPKPSSDQPDITADGRFVAFRSFATNIVPNDTNLFPDIFVRDRLLGATILLSAGGSGTAPARNPSSRPVFSRDGRTLIFQSFTSELSGPDLNRASDIFAYNLFASGDIPLFSTTLRKPVSGSGMLLTWPVIAGRSYRVQLKNDLADPVWQDVTNGVTILGSQGSLLDSSGGAGPRFYQVKAY